MAQRTLSPWSHLKRNLRGLKVSWKNNTLEACDWVCAHDWLHPDYNRQFGQHLKILTIIRRCLESSKHVQEVLNKLGVEGVQLIRNWETPCWLIADKIDECIELPLITEALRDEKACDECLMYVTFWLGIKRVMY